MKIRLPKIKKTLQDEDITDYIFWEFGNKCTLPGIEDISFILPNGIVNVYFVINNSTLGEIFGEVRVGADNINFGTMVVSTTVYEYKTKAQVKTLYKKVVKELITKYKEWVRGLYE